jgi:outer membrane protein assembly factor BamD (BamD/ComL family)
MSFRIRVESKNRPLNEEQLLGEMDHAWVFLEKHRRELLVGALLAVLAVCVVLGVLWYERRALDALAELDRQATALYLNRPAGEAVKADENLKQAIALYRKALDQYSNSEGSHLVLYKLGNALVQANDLQGAIDVYQQYLAKHGSNKLMLGMVYQRMAYAYMLKGDHEQAVKVFGGLIHVPGALNKDQALFELGKIEETQSRPEGALARYQELMKTYPGSPFAGEAAVRIKALEAKKPAEPASTQSTGATPTLMPATPSPSPQPANK